MIKKTTYIVTSVLLALLVYFIFSYLQYSQKREDLAITKGDKVTKALKNDVASILEKVMVSGREIATIMETQTLTSDAINLLLKERSIAINEILGITVAFEPNQYNDQHLYAPYYDKKADSIFQLEKFYDYTDAALETTTWYVKIRDGGEQWVEPYFGQVVQALITDYGIPFYNPDGSMKGMVSMTISLKGFTELIHSLSLGKTGFGFVTSKKGTVLAHPVSAYAGLKTLQQLQTEQIHPELRKAYSNILKGETGFVSFNIEEKKQKTRFYYDIVPASQWGIGVLFFDDDLLGADRETKQRLIQIAITGSLVLFCFLGLYFNRDYLSTQEVWILSLFGSFILLANVFYIGYLEHISKDHNTITESPPVIDNTTLSSIINAENLKAKKNNAANPIVIPTGVYIDELGFMDSYNVNISGSVWQKYPKTILDDITVGFQFPQASPFAESVYIEEIFREETNKHVLISYNFRLTAKLNFVYRKYPFDKRNLNLEIRPLNHNDNLFFTPDLDSYKVTNPSQKSGLSSNISLSGNRILESYFSYQYLDYGTTFGLKNNTHVSKVPELYFNINMKRVLINAFVTYLIPIFVTLIMMFIMVYASNKSHELISDSGIVQGMTAFFFVLVFSHIDLRKNIETTELIYMEYFYFITYIMIVLSTHNLIMYTRPNTSIFDYKNNLVVKAIFWPTFLILVLIVSLFLFY